MLKEQMTVEAGEGEIWTIKKHVFFETSYHSLLQNSKKFIMIPFLL